MDKEEIPNFASIFSHGLLIAPQLDPLDPPQLSLGFLFSFPPKPHYPNLPSPHTSLR